MKVSINEQELKKEIAYLGYKDLLYTLKSNIEYLESHNKNYTNEQYHRILTLKAFIQNMESIT